MRKHWTLYLFGLAILAWALTASQVAAQPIAAPAQQTATSKIETGLLDSLQASGASDFDVVMTEQADLSAAYAMTDWNARGEYVYQTLLDTATRTQKPLIDYLQAHGLKYSSFIAGNEVYVYSGNLTTATDFAAMPEVGSIRAPVTVYLDDSGPLVDGPFPLSQELSGNNAGIRSQTGVSDTLSAGAGPQSPQATTDWGILDTKTDQFWSTFGVKGDGIVVANIDTGVQWDHPALKAAFKCQNSPANPACWSDPTGECGSGGACDLAGHGTHTMGTMVASDDSSLAYIAGMAPHARWIACKAFVGNSGSTADLLACADWILAPNGNPDNRPNIVNNSWGGGGNDTWYQSKVQAWRAAGIFPAVSAGNSGPGCGTIGSPGDYQESFTSAAHDNTRTIADFSSRGPSAFGDNPYTKPNISAPGVNICSSVPGNQWSCGYSGTSMASPHTAGAVALLWSCNPGLEGKIDQTFQLLQNNSDAPTNGGNCGAPADGQGNFTYGYGYLDVLKAGQATCGQFGTLRGTVTSGGSALPGAMVRIVDANNSSFSWTLITDASGYYSQGMQPGTYNVTYAKYGYISGSYSGVAVNLHGTTTRNIDLSPALPITINGFVTDKVTGQPLVATVQVTTPINTPIFSTTVTTNPMDGSYSVSLYISTAYNFKVDALTPGYGELNYLSQTFDYSTERDFTLEADPVTCSAPGYRFVYTYYQDFEVNSGGYTASGSNSSWAWGVPTSGPGKAHSGNKVVATNLNGNYNNNENSILTSPNINLSSLSGKTIYLHWWQWVNVEKGADTVYVDVSNNGGSTWTNVYTFSDVDTTWKLHPIYLSPSYAVSNFRVRFRLVSDSTNTYPGWYIDDVGIGAVSEFNESFEGASFPPPGWSIYDNDIDTTSWALSTANPYTTTHNVVASPNHLFPGIIENDWLVSPVIYLGNTYSYATLYWWDSTLSPGSEHHMMGYCDEASPGGCGSPPYNYSLYDGFWPAQSAWTARSFTFGSGKQNHYVRVAWGYYGSNGGYWYVDAASVHLDNGVLIGTCQPAQAGPLTYTPPAVQATVNLGDAPSTQPLSIKNTGRSTSGFVINEYNLGFSPALTSQGLHIPAIKPGPPSANPLQPSILAEQATEAAQPPAAGERPSSPAVVDAPDLITGVPAYALAWKSSYNYALYSFNTATPGTWTEVGDFGNLFLTGADFLTGDTSHFYALGVYNNHIYTVNTSTAITTDLGTLLPVAGQTWGGMTGSMDGKLYASSSNCYHTELYTIDPVIPSATPLFEVTNAPCLDSIAMNAEGQMYGLDVKLDELIRIDLKSGAGTVIGPLGYNASFNQQMAFDQMSGVLYWAAFNNVSGELRVIDPATGASARVDTFPGPTWVTALLIPGNGGSDVPWLSENPASGILAGGASQAVTLTFTPPPVTTQPGTYSAQLRIGNDNPSGTGVVPVTMTATIPDTWGYIHGVVSGLGPCDSPGGPLPFAQVQIYTTSDVLVGATQTDASGVYNYAVPSGNYKVKASLLTYLPFETGGLAVPAGRQMLTQNFILRRNLPCLTASPTSLTGNVFAGNTLTLTLTISNTGGGDGTALLLKHLGNQTSTNLIQDPSFELYNSPPSPWQQYSANFTTPLWMYPSGNATPHTGDVFAWFGGYDRDIEEGYISQTVTLPTGSSAGLVFWLALPQCANGTSDYLVVTIDGNQIFKVDSTSSQCGDPKYYPQMMDISTYADGNKHTLEFYGYTTGGSISDFLVDDVLIVDPGWGKVLWLATAPSYVTIPAGTNQPFKVVFSPGSNNPGTYAAMLTLDGVPSAILNIPVSMVIGAPPTNLTATAVSQTRINLHWNDNSTNERGFMIERSPDGTTGWKVIDRVEPNTQNYPDESAPCGSTSYYRVRAFTAGGFSAYTNVAHDTTLPCSPAAPTNLTATTVITDHINLHWTDNSNNETGFQIEWSPDGTTGWTVLTTVGANVQDYPDSGLSCGTDRFYRVKAYNTGGSSGYTNVAHGSTLPCKPAVPTNLVVSAASQTWVSLSWTSHSSDEEGFKIERSLDGQTGWQVVGTVGAGVTNYTDPGLTPGKDYYYRVYAYHGSVNSDDSNVVHAVTKLYEIWLPLVKR